MRTQVKLRDQAYYCCKDYLKQHIVYNKMDDGYLVEEKDHLSSCAYKNDTYKKTRNEIVSHFQRHHKSDVYLKDILKHLTLCKCPMKHEDDDNLYIQFKTCLRYFCVFHYNNFKSQDSIKNGLPKKEFYCCTWDYIIQMIYNNYCQLLECYTCKQLNINTIRNNADYIYTDNYCNYYCPRCRRKYKDNQKMKKYTSDKKYSKKY